jgi:ATP-dependent Zn protease
MTIEERRSTAIHEAGHVIVAWTLGLPIGAMEIGINGDDTAGESQIADAALSLSMVDRVALCAAGLEAQRLFRCEATHQHAGLSDAAKMLGILDDLPDEEADNIRFDGYDRAFQILDQRRSLIERLAEPLALNGRLEEKDVRSLLSRP